MIRIVLDRDDLSALIAGRRVVHQAADYAPTAIEDLAVEIRLNLDRSRDPPEAREFLPVRKRVR